uniref:Uncharacterized protein n=1 Tax=Dulem virus 141 TaxID=3145618 RepID=A0AAU8AZW6_9VIRU
MAKRSLRHFLGYRNGFRMTIVKTVLRVVLRLLTLGLCAEIERRKEVKTDEEAKTSTEERK